MTLTQIGILFTIGGVVLTLLLAIMSGAFIAGKHSNRLDNLEKRQSNAEQEAKEAARIAGETTAKISGLEATLAALDKAVHDGFDRVEDALRSLAGRGRSRRAEEG